MDSEAAKECSRDFATRMRWVIGSRVEACSQEEGFGGAWFECKILGKIRDETGQVVNGFKVQYEKFVVRDGGEPLVEVVPASQIRPIPPTAVLPEQLRVGDKVEAYDSDCWWRGEIIKCWIGCSEPRFLVFFPDTATCCSYSRAQLRVRHDWIDGKWYRMFEDTSNRQRIRGWESGSLQRNERVTRKSKRIRQPTDLFALVRRYEVRAYKKVLRTFLRSGLNGSKVEILQRTADALNIGIAEQMDIYKRLIRH